MEFSVGWVISDALRMAMCVSQFVFAALQLHRAAGQEVIASSWRIQLMSLITSAVSFVWNLGAHNPLYFGWRPYLILNTFVLIMDAFIGCYLLYVLSSLYYTSMHHTLEFPRWTKWLFAFYGTIAIVCNVVATILILILDSLAWTTLRVSGIAFLIILAGGNTVFILLKLRTLLTRKMVSPSVPTDDRPRTRTTNLNSSGKFGTRLGSRGRTDSVPGGLHGRMSMHLPASDSPLPMNTYASSGVNEQPQQQHVACQYRDTGGGSHTHSIAKMRSYHRGSHSSSKDNDDTESDGIVKGEEESKISSSVTSRRSSIWGKNNDANDQGKGVGFTGTGKIGMNNSMKKEDLEEEGSQNIGRLAVGGVSLEHRSVTIDDDYKTQRVRHLRNMKVNPSGDSKIKHEAIEKTTEDDENKGRGSKIVVTAITAFLAWFSSTFTTEYSEATDEEAVEYDLGTDISNHVTVLLIYFYQYFARIPNAAQS
eukprot:jgi/Bigna1/87784/estExt_fgenesh1_pg.C_240086